MTAEEAKEGLGRLAVTSCAICFEDWKQGDDVRCAKCRAEGGADGMI